MSHKAQSMTMIGLIVAGSILFVATLVLMFTEIVIPAVQRSLEQRIVERATVTYVKPSKDGDVPAWRLEFTNQFYTIYNTPEGHNLTEKKTFFCGTMANNILYETDEQGKRVGAIPLLTVYTGGCDIENSNFNILFFAASETGAYRSTGSNFEIPYQGGKFILHCHVDHEKIDSYTFTRQKK